MTDTIPIRLPCPECGKLHIDEGDFATKVHHTHSCQFCGMTWRPAVVPTVGVQFLPGFKNDTPPPAASPPEKDEGVPEPGEFWLTDFRRSADRDFETVEVLAKKPDGSFQCRSKEALAWCFGAPGKGPMGNASFRLVRRTHRPALADGDFSDWSVPPEPYAALKERAESAESRANSLAAKLADETSQREGAEAMRDHERRCREGAEARVRELESLIDDLHGECNFWTTLNAKDGPLPTELRRVSLAARFMAYQRRPGGPFAALESSTSRPAVDGPARAETREPVLAERDERPGTAVSGHQPPTPPPSQGSGEAKAGEGCAPLLDHRRTCSYIKGVEDCTCCLLERQRIAELEQQVHKLLRELGENAHVQREGQAPKETAAGAGVSSVAATAGGEGADSQAQSGADGGVRTDVKEEKPQAVTGEVSDYDGARKMHEDNRSRWPGFPTWGQLPMDAKLRKIENYRFAHSRGVAKGRAEGAATREQARQKAIILRRSLEYTATPATREIARSLEAMLAEEGG